VQLAARLRATISEATRRADTPGADDGLTSSFVPHPSMPPETGTTMPDITGAQQLVDG